MKEMKEELTKYTTIDINDGILKLKIYLTKIT
jgi:hypothetical protein